MNLASRFRTDDLRRSMVMGAPGRADARLRMFARREGDAVFCRLCDGGGFVSTKLTSVSADRLKKCTRCGGEGLEPDE